MDIHFAFANKKLPILLILFFVVPFIAPVFAAHTANVTIYPNIANCNELGNTFTVTVTNNGGDDILQVEIYKALAGISSFSCGPAPDGWTLFEYTDRCIYVTGLGSSYKIEPGESLNFTFDAVMNSSSCTSDFDIITVDDAAPTGDRVTNTVSVSIDCSPPIITKVVGEPKLPGIGFDWWITQDTEIEITGSDSKDICDLGMDYCRWRYRVDNGNWSNWENQTAGCDGNVSFTISFDEDSVHDIQIECYDIAGNKATLNETDKVDSTPPNTTKTYGAPYFSNGTSEWITSSTPIYLNATDGGDVCAVGVEKIWYFDVVVNDTCCIDKANCTPVCPSPYEVYHCFENKNCVEWAQEQCANYTGGEWYDCVENKTNKCIKVFGVVYDVGAQYWGPGISCPGEWKLYRGEPIYKEEESCHVIQFLSADYLGNYENMNVQCVFVDNTPPVGTKTIGEPKISCGQINDSDCWWVRDHVTEINLTCEDQEPHPVNNEEVCFRVSFDDPQQPWLTEQYCDDVGGTMEGDWCCVASPTTIIFKEDSFHDLEYYCRDALGNANEPNLEYFKVDSLPPIINKTLSGPQVGNCSPKNESDKCWIKDWTSGNGTTIHIEAYDNDTLGCAVDQITCDWWYVLDGNQIINETHMQGLTPPFDIKFYDETEHELHVKCCDGLGNCYEDVETFYVDSSGPNVTKEFIGPWYRNQSGVEWIDTITNISLTATDNPDGECAVDNSTIYWRDNYFPNDGDWHYCYQACEGWNPQYPSNPLNPIGEGWNKYEGPFNDLNESCHVLEYYAVDALGNVGPIGINCFFSDHTEPVVKLTVKTPSIECENKSYCDYWVRDHVTQIHLNCENRGPHPSPLDKIQWRIWSDITGNWTEWNESQAGVCGYDVTIIFTEDSVHKIQYKCNDTVGKESNLKEKVFRVDSTPPVINKTMLGVEGKDWNGSCPPKNASDVCYVKGGSGISVSVYDPDPTGKGCAVGNVSCYYEVWWNSTLVDNGTFTNSTEIIFTEDSAHDVIIRCEDALGNYIEDNETFLVDSIPPVTTKTYGERKLSNGTHLWITSSTPIYLNATDNKIGVDYIEYRVTYIGNETCPEICDYNVTGNWTRVYGNFAQFTINEDSCHLIEYHAVDKFGNNETIHKQCVMVDDTPPVPNKTVGKPRTKWDGKDAVFYNISDKCWSDGNDSIECWKVTRGTPITMSCIDPEPHPVNHAKVCFAVEVDGVNKTKEYCNIYNGSYNESGDGFCCLNSTIENFTFLERTEHELEYYCVDALGNKGELDIEKFKVIGDPFKIKLNKKWNLISVPFVLLDNNATRVFRDISDKIDSVWTYDAATNQWFVYRPGKENTSNLKEINPGWGYWVMAYNDTELIIGGDLYNPAITPPGRELKQGWNLIGYYGLENETKNYEGPIGKGRIAYCALYTLRNEESIYPPTKWSSLLTYWEPLDEEFIELGVCDRLDPGAGYWIYVDEDKGYTRATVCPEWLVEEICEFSIYLLP